MKRLLARGGVASVATLLGAALFMHVLRAGQLPPPGSTKQAQPPPPGQVAPAQPEKTPAPTISAPAGPEPTKDDQAISVTTRYVLLPTTVIDRDSGGYVNGLRTNDFTVYDNDKAQKISSEFSEQAISVVLAVQANSEVEPMLPRIKKAAVLMQGLVTGENGDMAILAFDHRMRLMQDFTQDPDKLDDAMQKITAGSSTAGLIDAVVESDRMLKRHDPKGQRRRVVVMLTRNVDKGSQAHLPETVRQVGFDDILVYSIDISQFLTTFFKKPDYPRPPNGGIPSAAVPNLRGGTMDDTLVLQQQNGNILAATGPVYRSFRDLLKKTPAEALTQFTGGRIYTFGSDKSLERAVTDIGKELQSQYLLSYSPNNKEDPGFHAVRVDVNHPRLEIRTRKGYWSIGGKQ